MTARLYACPNIARRVNAVRADRSTPGFMRAPAEMPYPFAVESALDELAYALGMDPIELRRANLADYLLPVNADIIDVRAIMIPEEDKLVNAAGVKGVGEIGTVGMAAAISNAVYHATGRRLRDLPLRIEHLMEDT